MIDELIKELDWCIQNGNVGPRSLKALCAARVALAAPVTPAVETIGVQEAWLAAGGNPIIGANKPLLLNMLKSLYASYHELNEAPAVDAQPVAWMTKSDGYVFYGYNKPDRVEEDLLPLYASEQSEGLTWQLIETAPKDGTEVLLIATRYSMLMPHPERIVGAYRNGWWSGPSTLSHVTHWMPLPEAPAALSQKDPQ